MKSFQNVINHQTGSVIPGVTWSVQPVKVGSIVGLPPGSVVPAAMTTTNVVQTQAVPTTIQTEQVNLPTTPIQAAPTPTLRILPLKIVRNQLSPKYNTATLPEKVVTTRLPPLPTPPAVSVAIPPLTKTVVKIIPMPTPVKSIVVPP